MSNLPCFEDTPYASATLSGVVRVGTFLTLPCPHDNLAALGPTQMFDTASAGATIEFERAKLTAAAGTTTTISMTSGNLPSGDFRFLFRVDLVTAPWDNSSGGAGTAWRFSVGYGASDFIALAVNSTDTSKVQMLRTGGVSVGSVTAPGRSLWLRLDRRGNVFTGYVWDRVARAWTQIGTTTQAFASVPSGIIFYTNPTGAGATKVYFDDFQNFNTAGASEVTGTATGVCQVRGGLRQVNYSAWNPSTSTYTVQVRTAASEAGLSSASFSSVTDKQTFTPDPAQEWAEWKVTLTAPAGASALPYVGDLMLLGTWSQEQGELLARKAIGSLVRHTDANSRFAIDTAAVGGTGGDNSAQWSRVTGGIANWLNAGKGRSITVEGTTFDVVDIWKAGMDRASSDLVGSDQFALSMQGAMREIANCPTLRDAFTPTEKQAFRDNIEASLELAPPKVNSHTARAVIKTALTLLEAQDPGNWRTYTDADLDEHIDAAEAYYSGNGSGFWDDSTTDSTHFDAYTSVITSALGYIATNRPTYTRAALLSQRFNESNRAQAMNANEWGGAIEEGRTIAAATWGTGATPYSRLSSAGADLYPEWLEMQSRARIQMLTRVIFPPGFITTREHDYRSGGAVEQYSTTATSGPQLVGSFLADAVSTPLLTTPAPRLPAVLGRFVGVSPSSGQAWVRKSESHPTLYLSALNRDSGASDGGTTKYAWRAGARGWWQNTGMVNGNVPNVQQGFWFFRTSDMASQSTAFLHKTTAHRTGRIGRGAATWRQGVPVEFSPTLNDDTTNTVGASMTDIAFAFEDRVVAGTKIALASGKTLSTSALYSAPIPLAAGATLASESSGTDWRYAESPEGGQSFFIRNLTPGFGTTTSGIHGTEDTAKNRVRYQGRSLRAAGPTSGEAAYNCAEMAFRWGAMSDLAAQQVYLSAYSRSADLETFEDADGGISLRGYAGQVNPTLGLWSLTGASVKAFRGDKATGTWGGGFDLSALTHNGTALLSLASGAGNLAFDKEDAATTRVWTDAGDLTVHAGACPTGANHVWAVDVFYDRVDVTADCTFAGGAVTIPQSVVDAYRFDQAEFEITAEEAPSISLLVSSRRAGMAFKKGTANRVQFEMTDISEALQAGKTVTALISKDGAAFAAAEGTVAEIGGGAYAFAGTAADFTCDSFSLRFTAPDCRTYLMHGNTEADYTAARAGKLDLMDAVQAAAEDAAAAASDAAAQTLAVAAAAESANTAASGAATAAAGAKESADAAKEAALALPSATAIRAEIDTNSTKLAKIDGQTDGVEGPVAALQTSVNAAIAAIAAIEPAALTEEQAAQIALLAARFGQGTVEINEATNTETVRDAGGTVLATRTGTAAAGVGKRYTKFAPGG